MKKVKMFFRSMAFMGRKAPVYLLAILGMSVSFAMFSVMGSILMKMVVDMPRTGEYERLLISVVLIVCGGFFSLVLYRRCAITYNVEAKRVFGRLSGEVLDEEMHLPFSYYEKHHSGELISKLSYDLDGMGAIYGSRFRRVVMPMLQVAVFLIPMLAFCWQLTLCLVAVDCVMILFNMLTVDPIHKVKKQLSAINQSVTGHLSDMLQGMQTIRMFRTGRGKVGKLLECNAEYYRKNKAYIGISALLESFTVGCDLLCGVFFLLLGIYFVDRGITTLGAVAGIYTVYGRFSAQFLMIGKYIPELSACLANAENIFDFLDEEREPENWYGDRESFLTDGEDAVAESLALEVRNVSFAYQEGQQVLKDLSLEIAVNECVAITGPSGCGKTTLSKLILGLYPLGAGDIFIRGKSIREMPLSEVRKGIAYVPQDAYLFRGTIRENICYGCCEKEGVTEAEIKEAASMANAHEFIMGFAEGYDTMLNEGGANLSGGQRQRIAIARAIISKAPIILLDEATSALDSEAEHKVNQALRNIRGNKTVIMIAHRPSTIRMADRVIAF